MRRNVSSRRARRASSSRSANARRSVWTPSGIITLTTDFGLADPYVAAMKGVILSALRAATIVDVTHDIAPQDVRSAAWILKHARETFPPGTVHLAVVDPGVGSERKLLVAEDRGQALLAPDNGLIAPLLSRGARVFELDVERFARAGASRTFHGRDILAPAAAALAGGRSPARCASGEARRWVELDFPRPRPRRNGVVAGEIVARDRFGNLISNLAPEHLEASTAASARSDLSRWRIVAGARRIPIRGTYAEARPGALLALVDSYGALEIAVRDGSAAERLGIGPGAAITAERTT
jgi:S-adenosylmethionine hydrolase